MDEHGDKLDQPTKDGINAAIKELEESLKGDDKAVIDAKMQALATAAQKLGEAVYASQQQAAGAAGGAGAAGAGAAGEGAAPKDDNVVDADFKEVKDKE